jgi:Protein of unknown function (DUF3575)
MQKVIAILIFLISGANSSFAQVGALKGGFALCHQEDLTYGGIAMTRTGIGVTLEYRLGQKFTFAGNLDYVKGEGTKSSSFQGINYDQPYESRSWLFRPEFRFYPKESMHGFFIGAGAILGNAEKPLVSGSRIQLEQEFIFSLSTLLGLNLQITPQFCVEISGGLGGNDYGVYIPIGVKAGYSF